MTETQHAQRGFCGSPPYLIITHVISDSDVGQFRSRRLSSLLLLRSKCSAEPPIQQLPMDFRKIARDVYDLANSDEPPAPAVKEALDVIEEGLDIYG